MSDRPGAFAGPVIHAAHLGAGAPVLAMDVGGTSIKAARVDESGSFSPTVCAPTGDGIGGDGVIAALQSVAGEVVERFGAVVAAGVVVPGHVNDLDGVAVLSGNLGWRDYPFRSRAESALSLPVAFGHDVRSAGIAEMRFGAAAGFTDVVLVAIGTGISAAVFADGRLLRADGLVGEIGHAPVGGDLVCACGGRGCLETQASAAAIVRKYESVSGTSVSGAAEVVARMHSGDAAAREVWNSAIAALAFELAQVVSLLSPQAIVIAGGLSLAGEALLAPLRERLDAMLSFQRRPQLVQASFGAASGLVGAAIRARDLAADTARDVDPDAARDAGADTARDVAVEPTRVSA